MLCYVYKVGYKIVLFQKTERSNAECILQLHKLTERVILSTKVPINAIPLLFYRLFFWRPHVSPDQKTINAKAKSLEAVQLKIAITYQHTYKTSEKFAVLGLLVTTCFYFALWCYSQSLAGNDMPGVLSLNNWRLSCTTYLNVINAITALCCDRKTWVFEILDNIYPYKLPLTLLRDVFNKIHNFIGS